MESWWASEQGDHYIGQNTVTMQWSQLVSPAQLFNMGLIWISGPGWLLCSADVNYTWLAALLDSQHFVSFILAALLDSQHFVSFIM